MSERGRGSQVSFHLNLRSQLFPFSLELLLIVGIVAGSGTDTRERKRKTQQSIKLFQKKKS